jgi:hypothetical protein
LLLEIKAQPLSPQAPRPKASPVVSMLRRCIRSSFG